MAGELKQGPVQVNTLLRLLTTIGKTLMIVLPQRNMIRTGLELPIHILIIIISMQVPYSGIYYLNSVTTVSHPQKFQ